MEKRNRKMTLGVCFGACLILIGIICLAVPKMGNHRGVEIDFDSLVTDMERENMNHDMLEKYLTAVFEQVDKVSDCEVNIDWLENEAASVTVKITLSEHGIENETFKADIAEAASRAVGISAEDVVVLLNI